MSLHMLRPALKGQSLYTLSEIADAMGSHVSERDLLKQAVNDSDFPAPVVQVKSEWSSEQH